MVILLNVTLKVDGSAQMPCGVKWAADSGASLCGALKWPVLQAVKVNKHLAPAPAGVRWREGICEQERLTVEALVACVLL